MSAISKPLWLAPGRNEQRHGNNGYLSCTRFGDTNIRRFWHRRVIMQRRTFSREFKLGAASSPRADELISTKGSLPLSCSNPDSPQGPKMGH